MSDESSKWRRQRVTLERRIIQTCTVETIIPAGATSSTAIRIAEAIADEQGWGEMTKELNSLSVNTVTELTVPG